jgi:hypothetical protein
MCTSHGRFLISGEMFDCNGKFPEKVELLKKVNTGWINSREDWCPIGDGKAIFLSLSCNKTSLIYVIDKN